MLQVKSLGFSYDSKQILSDISFELPTGASMAIMGESGCGKSTLLKLLYGLLDADHGHIVWNGQRVTGPKFNLVPGVDQMKYLAQDFDLMPYITVAENVGKFLSNRYPQDKKKRVRELLDLVQMSEMAEVKVQFLSGGQMQRVALARVLALEPALVLLDEPFSHIDNFRKNQLRRHIFGYLQDRNISCVVATHDRADVLGFTHRTLVLQQGKSIAWDDSISLYQNPGQHYVASLFDEVSTLPAEVIGLERSSQEVLVYPHQLRVVPQSLCPVSVVQSYFRGTAYLVEARFFERIVFFEHPVFLAPQTRVCLQYLS